MKFLSQLFEARGTNWTSKAFKAARFKLILLYLVIIALVITLFATLVVLQVNEKADSQKIPANSKIILSAQEAKNLAQTLKPKEIIEDAEYVLEENTLHYIVGFSDGEDVEVDLLIGKAQLGQDGVGGESFSELFTDDINERIGWIGISVFLLASLGSITIASMTLQPIAISIRKQKQFVSDASHELRNPLASLKTTLESYVRSSDKSLSLSESVACDLLEEVERLIATSESLLALERQEKQAKKIEFCDVSNNLARVLQSLQNDLNIKSITVIKNIASVPLKISSVDLDTILYNLLHNAVKFSGKNSEITVSWSGKELVVSDTGQGINAEHIPHIFERFYKADQARTFNSNSNGLGLALVYEIITSYGGTIAVESTFNEGASFTVTM